MRPRAKFTGTLSLRVRWNAVLDLKPFARHLMLGCDTGANDLNSITVLGMGYEQKPARRRCLWRFFLSLLGPPFKMHV